MARTVTLSRKVSFSSGHRYWRDDLDEGQNRALFGRWASPFNHGHNYELWVSADGPVDDATGMVVNIKWIDDLLQERIVARFDQRSLNDEVPELAGKPPCLETLLQHIAAEFGGGGLPGGVGLKAVKLVETPLLYGEWDMGQLSLTRVYEFAAAHRLAVPSMGEEENWRLFGKCHNPNGHGHNYVLEVTVTGEPDPSTGFLTDIDSMDETVHLEVIDRYDHKNLDLDIPELRGKNTTSEVVAGAIFDRLKDKVKPRLQRIRLYETARNVFEVGSDTGG